MTSSQIKKEARAKLKDKYGSCICAYIVWGLFAGLECILGILFPVKILGLILRIIPETPTLDLIVGLAFIIPYIQMSNTVFYRELIPLTVGKATNVGGATI